MGTLRNAKRRRKPVRIGAPDPNLTRNAGLVTLTELTDRLGVVEALDTAVGPIKQRNRGFGAGELLVGLAAAQLAGEDFLVGLDRQRADVAGQQLSPVPALCSTTAAGLARRFTDEQWRDVEAGLARVHQRMFDLLPAAAQVRLASRVTIDIDTTDVEVYGRQKHGVAYNYAGQRCGRPHVATWAQTETTLVADLGSGRDDPRASASGVLRRALAGLPTPVRAARHIAVRADAGYFAGELAWAAHVEGIGFAIGAKRIAPLWRLLAGIAEDEWVDAIDMDGAQVAVAGYRPRQWPPGTRLLIRRVRLTPEQISADSRSSECASLKWPHLEP